MRVIHVVPAITEEASGPSYSVVRLCQSLIQAGEDLTLVALDWSPLPFFNKTAPVTDGLHAAQPQGGSLRHRVVRTGNHFEW